MLPMLEFQSRLLTNGIVKICCSTMALINKAANCTAMICFDLDPIVFGAVSRILPYLQDAGLLVVSYAVGAWLTCFRLWLKHLAYQFSFRSLGDKNDQTLHGRQKIPHEQYR